MASLILGAVLAVIDVLGAGVLAGALAVGVLLARRGRVTGRVQRFDEHAPGGPGILILFHSADGREEFWARAGSVSAGVGDTVSVYYDPARPAPTATVQTGSDIRAWATAAMGFALMFAFLAWASLTVS